MSAPRLHLVMACSRRWNLPHLAWHYLCEMEKHPFELRWHLMFQGPQPDPKGSNKFNEGIDCVTDGWFYVVADDTVQHPSLFRRLGELILENPDAGAIVFSGVCRASKDSVKPCCICGSMIFYRKDFVGGTRYDFQKHGDQNDGYMAQELFQKDPSRWVFVDESLTRMNALM